MRGGSTDSRVFGQEEAWAKVITLNLVRVFSLTQKCLPLLREGAKQGGREGRSYVDPARIINVSPMLIVMQSTSLMRG